MHAPSASSGRFANGVGYNRFGRGPRTLVVLQGLVYEHAPLRGIAAFSQRSMYRYLLRDYTVYLLVPRAGLPQGTSLADMARDYARVMREALPIPVDVIGTSTGGSVAQHLAADHPDVVRRLVLHGTGHELNPRGKAAQLRTAELAAQGRWREASAALLEPMLADNLGGRMAMALMSRGMSLSVPDDPNDLIVTVHAEDAHAFRERLGEIVAPTLVIDGEDDGFYTPDILRETAAGIPGARLVLYPGKNHGGSGPALHRDILAFLRG